MRPERIPLFPLNVVLLPGAELPLHIFEPRYREMVRNALENKTEFGMLLSLPKGLARFGCTAEILEVLKREDDGTMDILTVGRAPFRVLELFTAVVVDAILDLTLFLGKTVIFPSGVADLKGLSVISLSGVILSLLLLNSFRLKVIPLILLGIGFGSIRYFMGF